MNYLIFCINIKRARARCALHELWDDLSEPITAARSGRTAFPDINTSYTRYYAISDIYAVYLSIMDRGGKIE